MVDVSKCSLGIYLTRAGTTPGYINQTGQYIFTSERLGLTYECLVGDRLSVRVAYNGSGATRNISLTQSIFEGYLLQPENNTVTTTTDLTTNSLTTNNITTDGDVSMNSNVSVGGTIDVSSISIDNNLNGQPFIRTVAIAKILGNGGNSKAVGCSVTWTNTGRYTCTLSPARPDSHYVVQLTCMETSQTLNNVEQYLDDVIIHVNDASQTTTGFDYFIHEQDNSGHPGTYKDKNHFITVFDTD